MSQREQGLSVENFKRWKTTPGHCAWEDRSTTVADRVVLTLQGVNSVFAGTIYPSEPEVGFQPSIIEVYHRWGRAVLPNLVVIPRTVSPGSCSFFICLRRQKTQNSGQSYEVLPRSRRRLHARGTIV